MSATGRYKLLFTPLQLGPVVVRNRIVFSAHLTNYAEHGRPTAQHAAYYEARAAGGAGLIITEEHATHPTDWPYEKMIHGFDPSVIDGYRRITDAVHRHETPIFAQINHNGGQGSGMYSRLPLWAPSAIPDPLFREVPKTVDLAEIDEIVDGYARVATHCVDGGFDGIELQCSHSSIVRGFLSPATNRRDDEYGGSLENRSRLLHRLVGAVRSAIGPGIALGVRLCGDELIEGGTTIEDALAIATALEAGGLIDYVNTSIGVATATLYMIEASMQVPPGYALWIASALRKAVSLPVIGVGRFKDPLQADRALIEGHADLIGVVRGQIADADFVAKARAGNASWIRNCLSCNQECVGRMGLNRWLGCIENPRTGRESVRPGPAPMRARRILVVGAGPGGMQAAIAAARRGHEVDLYEANTQPGGQVRVAASVPSRAEFGDLVRNQLSEASRLGVRVHLGQRVDRAFVEGLAVDAIVIATGARPERPWWAGSSSRVVDVVDVLEGREHPSGRVLVVDDLGFHQATSVAELLADRGCSLEVLSAAMVVGQDLGITLDQETWWMKAAAKGIAETTDTIVTGVTESAAGTVVVDLQRHTTGTAAEREVDWVVCASPPRADDALWRELREALGPAVELHRVGDCVAPRRAHAAVIEGDQVGSTLWSLCVVRDGMLPLGAEETIDEAGGRAVVVGSGTEAAADVLERAATELVLVECGAFRPAGWALGLAPLLREEDAIILPASADGRDLAPRIAHTLRRRLFAPTIGASSSLVTVVRGGGLFLEDVESPGPFVATLQPGCRGRDPARTDPAARRSASVVLESNGSDPELIAIRAPDPATVELGEATRIMAGGAGLGRAEWMDALGRLAGRLGCSLGATRVVADAGWVDFERQIGTTGAVVDPDLYIAVGISGALQHVSGLGHPRDIVSVNLDPSCPMMALADLAIVTDAPGFVDALGRRLGVETEERGA